MSGGFTTSSPDYLIRASLYSSEIKEQLKDTLLTEQYVQLLTDFPDGDTFNIPSVGTFTATNRTENTPVKYSALDTGNFQFTIDKNIEVGTYITDEQKQDSYLYSQISAKIVPYFNEAIKTHWEETVLALQSSQTSASLNNINGFAHRFVGGGTNGAATINDFLKMKLAFDKANVPYEGRVAVVDPTVSYSLSKNSVTTQVHPAWERVLPDGLSQNMRFVTTLHGFDIYESNKLSIVASETVNSVSVTNGAANLFFSANPLAKTFVGAWRAMPAIEGGRDMDNKRDKYNMTARYGVKVYRPESLGVILTPTGQSSL